MLRVILSVLFLVATHVANLMYPGDMPLPDSGWAYAYSAFVFVAGVYLIVTGFLHWLSVDDAPFWLKSVVLVSSMAAGVLYWHFTRGAMQGPGDMLGSGIAIGLPLYSLAFGLVQVRRQWRTRAAA